MLSDGVSPDRFTFRVHHDDVDDTSMTYGTRHMDKKTHSKGDESNAAVPAASSQDPHEDAAAVAAPAAAPQPATSEPPKEKRGIQVLISFSSEQAETLIREDVLHRLFARFGAVLDCVVKGHSSSPNYHPYHHSGGHHGDAGPRDAAQSGYGFVIFEHEEDAQRCLEHFQSPAAAEAAAAAAANGDATQTTDAPTVTPTLRLTDELTGLSVACELRIAKPRAPVHGHAAHRHGRRGPSGFGSGNVSRSTSTSPRAQRPTSGNLTGHLHGLAPDAAGGAHLYASNAAVYNTPPHGGSAVPLYGQPQQLLMMQGFMQYTGSEFYSPSPSVSRTQSVQSNYSSRSTSPRLSMSNGPNGSSVGTPQQAAYGGAGSPRTGSPRLSGMMHMGNVVYHTPQHAPGPASGGGSGGVYMMTPPSGYVQSISSLNSSRSTSPRLAPYSGGGAAGGGPGGAVYVSPAPYYSEGAYLQSLAMAPQSAYGTAQNAQPSQLQYSSPRASPPTVSHGGGPHAAGHSGGLPSILAANIPAELQGSVSLAHQQHHQPQAQHFDQAHGHVGYGYAPAGYASYDSAPQGQPSAPQGHSVYVDGGGASSNAAGGAYYVPMMPPLPPPLPMPMTMSVPMHLPPPHSMSAGPPPMQPLPAPYVGGGGGGSGGYAQQSSGGYYDAAHHPSHQSHQSHQSSPRFHPGHPGQ